MFQLQWLFYLPVKHATSLENHYLQALRAHLYQSVMKHFYVNRGGQFHNYKGVFMLFVWNYEWFDEDENIANYILWLSH